MLENSTAILAPFLEPGIADSLGATARLEFQASLQLLVDRACWITGAHHGAIALQQDRNYTYLAVSGLSTREPGANVASDVEPVRTCIAEGWTVRRGPEGEPASFSMAVPVVQDGKAIGFIELASDREFTEEVTEAVARIAELVTVTVENRDAAERAERLEFREAELALPSLWHAPEAEAQLEHRVAALIEAQNQPPVREVRACAACGFPVSPGRSLCVECDQKPGSAAVASSLFETGKEESWLSAHGYTLASILVTALTIAIILWLRH